METNQNPKPSLFFRRKLRIDEAFAWDHHCGGWRDVIRVIEKDLSTAKGTRFISAVEMQMFIAGPVQEPWVGFIHQVPWQDRSRHNLTNLLKLDAWRQSLPYCRGLWAMTEYQRDYLNELHVEVPIEIIRYPVAKTRQPFSPEQFRYASPRKLYCIGGFLRDWQAFYDLKAEGFQKVILRNHEFDKYYSSLAINKSVHIEPRASATEYHRIFSEHVVFLHLIDAVAVTVMLECIAAATPLVVNCVGATAEYLGKQYPLFYCSLGEATEHISNEQRLLQAHTYLKELPTRRDYELDHFTDRLQRTNIYQALPDPYIERPQRDYPLL